MYSKNIKASASTKETIILFIYFLRDAKYVSPIVISLHRQAKLHVK